VVVIAPLSARDAAPWYRNLSLTACSARLTESVWPKGPARRLRWDDGAITPRIGLLVLAPSICYSVGRELRWLGPDRGATFMVLPGMKFAPSVGATRSYRGCRGSGTCAGSVAPDLLMVLVGSSAPRRGCLATRSDGRRRGDESSALQALSVIVGGSPLRPPAEARPVSSPIAVCCGVFSGVR